MDKSPGPWIVVTSAGYIPGHNAPGYTGFYKYKDRLVATWQLNLSKRHTNTDDFAFSCGWVPAVYQSRPQGMLVVSRHTSTTVCLITVKLQLHCFRTIRMLQLQLQFYKSWSIAITITFSSIKPNLQLQSHTLCLPGWYAKLTGVIYCAYLKDKYWIKRFCKLYLCVLIN